MIFLKTSWPACSRKRTTPTALDAGTGLGKMMKQLKSCYCQRQPGLDISGEKTGLFATT
jgi:hypothetical protein